MEKGDNSQQMQYAIILLHLFTTPMLMFTFLKLYTSKNQLFQVVVFLSYTY